MNDNNGIDFKSFPTTRYQGSKRKILHWIYDNIKDLEFETALDAFGGSGSVSYLLKKMGKSVTYNDKLKFNFFTGKALIENDAVLFTDEDKDRLLGHDLVTPKIIESNFKGIYFKDNENKWLDKVSYGIMNMNHYTGQVLTCKKAIAYHALCQASLIKRPFNLFHRKNLSLRTNDVERSFGNKTAWEKKFVNHFQDFIFEANTAVFSSSQKCKAINKSVFKIDNLPYDLVYLDPPYLNKNGSNETSNYLKCYHFLEGIVNYNNWENMIDYETSNLRLKNTVDKDFTVENIYTTFDRLFEKFSDSIIVLSYKKGGTPSIEYLVKRLKKYKRKVYTKSMHYKYALNHQNDDAKNNREVLIIGV